MADDSSSVFPKASNTWSSFGLRSPVNVLEKPGGTEQGSSQPVEARAREQGCTGLVFQVKMNDNLCLQFWCIS